MSSVHLSQITLWLVIIVIAIMIWQVLQGTRQAEDDIDFSTFLELVDNGDIRKVTITGHKITGEYTVEREGFSNFQTYAPDYDNLVDILREKHPDTPILIMSKIRYTSATFGSPTYEMWMGNREFQRTLVEKRKAAGDTNIFFLDGSTVLGDDYYECTVDGSHPTDLGSIRIADALTDAINSILANQ